MGGEIGAQDFHQGLGELEAVSGSIAQARTIGFDLKAGDIALRSAVTLDGVTTAKERLRGHGNARAGRGRKAFELKESTEALRTAQKLGVSAETALGDPAQAACIDIGRLIERFVTVREIERRVEIAKLDACLGMAVAVEVDEKGDAELLHRCGAGLSDEVVVLGPGVLCLRVVLSGLGKRAVCIELAAVEAADDEMRLVAGLVMNDGCNGACEFLSEGVGIDNTTGAVRDVGGLEMAAVRCGNDEWEIARNVLDEAVASEDAGARREICCRTDARSEQCEDGKQGSHWQTRNLQG